MLFFFVSFGHLNNVIEEDSKEEYANKAITSSDPVFVGTRNSSVEEEED